VSFRKHCLFFNLLLSLILLLSAGCATIDGPPDPDDPFESYNRSIYAFNSALDESIVKPVSETYQEVVPEVISKGISNFFSNIGDIVVIANDLLQLKFIQAGLDLSRFFFNTTVGLFGFIDVATHLDLRKHHEDFGQTLGYWGVPRGPYFMLPFFGSRTVRDTVGFATDSVYIDPVYGELDAGPAAVAVVVDAIDTRASLLLASKLLDQAALDPYIYLRNAYLQRRLYLIYDGDPPEPDDDF